MASRTVSTLKFVGSISLGLLTGLSYTLSTLTLPTLLNLPSATSASRAFTNLTTISLTHLRALAGISTSSFLLAYLLSPRSVRHPYLLWTSLFVIGSGLSDFVLRPESAKTIAGAKQAGLKRLQKEKEEKKKKNQNKQRQMDASYEVLGSSDRDSEEATSGDEVEAEDEGINGEEVRVQMEGFRQSQMIRTVIAGVGFMMSVIGIWGDGSADLVIIEM